MLNTKLVLLEATHLKYQKTNRPQIKTFIDFKFSELSN